MSILIGTQSPGLQGDLATHATQQQDPKRRKERRQRMRIEVQAPQGDGRAKPIIILKPLSPTEEDPHLKSARAALETLNLGDNNSQQHHKPNFGTHLSISPKSEPPSPLHSPKQFSLGSSEPSKSRKRESLPSDFSTEESFLNGEDLSEELRAKTTRLHFRQVDFSGDEDESQCCWKGSKNALQKHEKKARLLDLQSQFPHLNELVFDNCFIGKKLQQLEAFRKLKILRIINDQTVNDAVIAQSKTVIERLIALNFSLCAQITNKTLEFLVENCPRLNSLNFTGTQISNLSLLTKVVNNPNTQRKQTIQTLPWLERLVIAKCPIQDKDLESLKDCTSLHVIDISECIVTNAGLQYLVNIPNLRSVKINNCKFITVHGVKETIASHPPVEHIEMANVRGAENDVKALGAQLAAKKVKEGTKPQAHADARRHRRSRRGDLPELLPASSAAVANLQVPEAHHPFAVT